MVKRSPAEYVLLFLLLAVLLAPRNAAAVPPQDILIVHSYHQGFLWTDNLMAGMLDVLQREAPGAQIHVEYLDAKRYPPETFGPLLIETLSRKTSRLKPKVILVSDDAAFDLMLSLRNELFPGVPLVFCGVNNFQDERIAGQIEVTGVVEDFDIKSTIDVILTLHRQVSHLAVISDSTETGVINLDRFRQVAPAFADRLKFLELYDLSTEELLGKLAKLPPETIILNLSFFRDRLGQSYSTRDGNKLIAAHAGRAIYSCWDYFLVGDVVGGYMTSGRQQGEEAATMVGAILKGIRANDIPIIRTSPNTYMFDDNVMERFGIKRSALPNGSVVLNSQVSMLEQYWGWFLGVALFCCVQMVLIFSLLHHRRLSRKATATLSASESNYRLLVEQQTDMVVKVDTAGRFLYVSPSYCRVFDKREDELLGKTFMPLVHEEDRPTTEAAMRSLFSPPHTAYIEQRALTSDGWRWLAWKDTAILGLDGQIEEIIGVGSDITERKRAEQALRESEEKYRILFNIFPLGITVSDPSGNIVESNPRAAELLGIVKDEHETRRIDGEQWQIIRPDGTLMPATEWASVRALQENRLVENTAMGIVKSGGKITWINVTAAPLPLENYGVVITYNDITDRKAAEDALKNREYLLNKIFDVLPIGLWFADKNGKLLQGNPAGVRIWGAEPTVPMEEYGVFKARRLPSGKEIAPDDWALAHTIREGATIVDELLEIDSFDGKKKIIVNYTAPVLDDLGNIQGAIVVNHDITEREQLHAQLQQAQKMESVGRLAGGVAHDFNNMLGVIFGHTEMALEDADPAAPLYASLQAIQHAAERSAALTRQLLAFARKQTIAPKVIDINETVAGMLNMLRRLIGEDIDLLWQPGKDLPPVKVDPAQIDQLLANLCVNARDAIAGQGKITIGTGAKTFDEAYCADHFGFLPGEYLVLEVSDDGCGMDKKILNHIFEPFFTTKEQGKGTGLGLASVFGMVQQNQGFIYVDSEPGKGTAFKIYLPAYAEKSAGVVEKAPDLPTEQGNETILLVEDEPAILQMTTMMLTRLGYTVVAAATPGEAIRQALEYRGKIDLLMTDVVMPEMNGRELAGNLLSHYPDLKRLFMSGYTADIIAHHGVLDEGVHFTQKPFSMKELGRTLRETLES
jgi:PAS domain S-box-containing protein